MKKEILFIRGILFILPAFIFSCQSGNSQSILEPTSFKQKTELAGTVVVDVRSPAEFSDGHLPGALNVDIDNPDFRKMIEKLDTSKTYLLYCHSGGRSHQAAGKMKQAGFKKIFEMKGGFPDWQEAGYPVEK